MKTKNVLPVELHRGTPSMRDWTPGSDVMGGTLVNVGGRVHVVHLDIKANHKGAVSAPDGSAAYRVTLHTGGVYADGDQVLVDVAGNETAAAGVHMGYAEEAADQTAGDTYVVVQLVDKAGA